MAALSWLFPVLLLAMFIDDGESVRCWACSSDLSPSCGDPFYQDNYRGGYGSQLENCDAASGANYYLATSKSVCKKQKKYVNGELVISRGCTWKRQDDYSHMCPSTTDTSNEYLSFCETCDYDGCNGASAISKTIALVMAPFALLLFK